MKLSCLAILLLFSHGALADENVAREQMLYSMFRCVVCEGQSLSESDAAIAIDMRNFIDKQVQAGKSDEEIVETLVASYGQTILMEPPVEGEHIAIWLLPLILLSAGGFLLFRCLRRQAS